jgi:serine/threonine protein kinase
MGVVFLARDPLGISATDPHSASGLVAVKVPRPELARDARARDRFLAEARHLQQFDHPHILRVLEIQTASDHPYLVMPHLRRGNLAQYLRHRSRLSTSEVLALSLQVASALLHAHKHGIIHRDIKPANVLLDDQGRAVLTDFGLARSVFNESVIDITREHREGTAPYMSPAVARGEAEDTRCDIYAFGALLYEMLAGRPPYAGDSFAVITHQILTSTPPSVLSVRPDAPPDLARVAEWAMARQLRHRYAHMVDVVADLQRIEAGLRPLGPHEGNSPSRATVLFDRVCRPFNLGLAAALLFLAGGAALLWNLGRNHTAHYDPTSDTPQLGLHSAVPESPDHQPWFLLRGQELLMLQAGHASQVHVTRRYRLPWLPSSASPEVAPVEVRVDLLSDIDQDGRQELLLRTAAPQQGAFVTLACFEVDSGDLKWVRHDAEGFLPPALVSLDRQGTRGILVLTHGQKNAPAEARLLAPDGQTLYSAVHWTQPITWHRRASKQGRGWELVIDKAAESHLASVTGLMSSESASSSAATPDRDSLQPHDGSRNVR